MTIPAPAPDRDTGDESTPPASASGNPKTAGAFDPLAAVAVMPVEVATPLAADKAAKLWPGTVIDLVPTEADDVAALALTVPDVVRLHAGRFGEVATYLPGRRVTGVRLRDDVIEVHVVVAGQVPIRETARQLQTSVAALVGKPVHVYVEDVDVPRPTDATL